MAVVRANSLSFLNTKSTLIKILKHGISVSDLQESALILLKVVLDSKDPDLYLLIVREGLRKQVEGCIIKNPKEKPRTIVKENIAETILQKQLNNPTYQTELEEEHFTA